MRLLAETEKGQYVKDAKVDQLLYEEAKGVTERGKDQRSCSLDVEHHVVLGFEMRMCIASYRVADGRLDIAYGLEVKLNVR